MLFIIFFWIFSAAIAGVIFSNIKLFKSIYRSGSSAWSCIGYVILRTICSFIAAFAVIAYIGIIIRIILFVIF